MVNPSTAIHNQDGSDAVPPTTRPTISYYLVLVLLVIPFCAVTPASWCYVVYSLYTGSIRAFTSRQYIVFAVALAEVGPTLGMHVMPDNNSRGRIHPGFI
jgi:hypothetical protein